MSGVKIIHNKRLSLRYGRAHILFIISTFVAVSLYVLQRYYQAVLLGGAPLNIHLSSDKVLLVIILLLVVPKSNIRINKLLIFKILIYSYLLLYFLMKAQGINRPEVITESNIELMLHICLYIYYSKKINRKDFFALLFLIVLSGSFSVLVSFFSVIAFLNRKKLKLNHIFLIFIGLVLIIMLSIQRGYEGIEDIDRYHYLLATLNDMRELSDNYGNIWTGMPVFTPVSEASCLLSPWKRDYVSGYCYSNAYNLSWARILWDHGLFGILIISFLYYSVLRWKGFESELALGIFFAGALNGVSVSGIGNTFILIAVVMLIFFRDSRKHNGFNNNY